MKILVLAMLLSPLVLGFLLPVAISLGLHKIEKSASGMKDLTRVVKYCLIVIAVILGFLLVIEIISQGDVVTVLKLFLFLIPFSLAVFAVFYFFHILGVRLSICQIICYFLVTMVHGTIFFSNPIIEKMEKEQFSGEEITRIVNFGISVNPYAIIGNSVLGVDVLRNRYFYNLSLIPYYNFRYPTLWEAIRFYLILSICILLLAVITRSVKKYES